MQSILIEYILFLAGIYALCLFYSSLRISSLWKGYTDSYPDHSHAFFCPVSGYILYQAFLFRIQVSAW